MENLPQPAEKPKEEVKRYRAKWWIVGICLAIPFILVVLVSYDIVAGLVTVVVTGSIPSLAALIARLFKAKRWHITFLISWIIWIVILIVGIIILVMLMGQIFTKIFEAVINGIFSR
jgi:beta-lactamase regulating signal transducer with metallopeptidase domain